MNFNTTTEFVIQQSNIKPSRVVYVKYMTISLRTKTLHLYSLFIRPHAFIITLPLDQFKFRYEVCYRSALSCISKQGISHVQ